MHLLTKEEVVVHEAVRQQNQNEDKIELHPHRSDALWSESSPQGSASGEYVLCRCPGFRNFYTEAVAQL